MATLGLLKIKLFWKESYDAIISDHDVTKKNLSHDWNYNVGAIMWPKFGNFRISIREVIEIQLQFYKDLIRKTTFLRSGLGPTSIIRDLALGKN